MIILKMSCPAPYNGNDKPVLSKSNNANDDNGYNEDWPLTNRTCSFTLTFSRQSDFFFSSGNLIETATQNVSMSEAFNCLSLRDILKANHVVDVSSYVL